MRRAACRRRPARASEPSSPELHGPVLRVGRRSSPRTVLVCQLAAARSGSPRSRRPRCPYPPPRVCSRSAAARYFDGSAARTAPRTMSDGGLIATVAVRNSPASRHYGRGNLAGGWCCGAHQPVDDLAQRLLLARARGLPVDRLGQPLGASDPHGVLADAGESAAAPRAATSSASCAIDIRRRAVASRNSPCSASLSLSAAISSRRCASSSAARRWRSRSFQRSTRCSCSCSASTRRVRCARVLMLTPPPASP